MSDIKIPLEKVMGMSLDEYIEETGIYNPNYREKQKLQPENSIKTNDSNDNDDDFIMLDTNETNDLYSDDIPKPSSSQWRLLPPNVPDHPAGMPPLVPIKAEILHNSLRSSNISFDNKNYQYRYQNHQNKRYNNNNNNGGRQFQHRQNKSVNGTNNSETKNITLQNNGTGFVNKRYRNRNHQRNYYNNNNNNNNRQFNGINYQSKPSNIQHRLNMNNDLNQQNVIGNAGQNSNNIQSLLDIDLRTKVPKKEMKMLPIREADSSTKTITTNNNNDKNVIVGENFLKNCFNTLPMIAAQLLEQIDSIRSVKLEKKYDMKVQKEISEIQGKQLLYTCPGAAVVSFDGPGIDCDTPKPHTTDMSLNQRFA